MLPPAASDTLQLQNRTSLALPTASLDIRTIARNLANFKQGARQGSDGIPSRAVVGFDSDSPLIMLNLFKISASSGVFPGVTCNNSVPQGRIFHDSSGYFASNHAPDIFRVVKVDKMFHRELFRRSQHPYSQTARTSSVPLQPRLYL